MLKHWRLVTALIFSILGVVGGLSTQSAVRGAISDVLEAEILLSYEDYGEAERRLRRALRRVPSLAAAHHALGRLRLRQGRRAEAEQEFLEAAQLLSHTRVDRRPGIATAQTSAGRPLVLYERADVAMGHSPRHVEDLSMSQQVATWIEGEEVLIRRTALHAGAAGRQHLS